MTQRPQPTKAAHTLRLADPPAPRHRFGTAPSFRVSVEEELFLLDEHLHDGVIALTGPASATAAQATAGLREARAAAADAFACRLLGAGLHPAAPLTPAAPAADHAAPPAADGGGGLRRATSCALHVRVAMPDPETAIAACNGMRKWIPLLHAVGANSPFRHGVDSGLAGGRAAHLRGLSRATLPRAFTSWADCTSTAERLVGAFGREGPDALGWAVRPDAARGTLEVRVADAQASLDDVEGIVALTHLLVLHEALTQDTDEAPAELLDASCAQAIRHGLDARMSTDGRPRHMQEVAATAQELARGYARPLACEGSLAKLEALLRAGGGAGRQRAAFARGGLPAVLRHLAAATAQSAVSSGARRKIS